MPWTVKAQLDAGFVELTLEGAVDRHQLQETRERVYQLLEENDFKYALVDMRRIDWRMSTVRIHEFAEAVKHPLHMQIIVVCRPDDQDAQFFATVAKNRGRQMQVFTDYERAREALCS